MSLSTTGYRQRHTSPFDSVIELDRGVSCEVAELPEVWSLADLNEIRHKNKEDSATKRVSRVWSLPGQERRELSK